MIFEVIFCGQSVPPKTFENQLKRVIKKQRPVPHEYKIDEV
jgi:hypothetical protein